MFPTLDPPATQRSIGHWVTICLNLKQERFQYLDSLFTVDSNVGWAIFNKMVKNIKTLWTDCSVDMPNPYMPLSIDNFKSEYMNVPRQTNGLVYYFLLVSFGYNPYRLLCFNYV